MMDLTKDQLLTNNADDPVDILLGIHELKNKSIYVPRKVDYTIKRAYVSSDIEPQDDFFTAFLARHINAIETGYSETREYPHSFILPTDRRCIVLWEGDVEMEGLYDLQDEFALESYKHVTTRCFRCNRISFSDIESDTRYCYACAKLLKAREYTDKVLRQFAPKEKEDIPNRSASIYGSVLDEAVIENIVSGTANFTIKS